MSDDDAVPGPSAGGPVLAVVGLTVALGGLFALPYETEGPVRYGFVEFRSAVVDSGVTFPGLLHVWWSFGLVALVGLIVLAVAFVAASPRARRGAAAFGAVLAGVTILGQLLVLANTSTIVAIETSYRDNGPAVLAHAALGVWVSLAGLAVLLVALAGTAARGGGPDEPLPAVGVAVVALGMIAATGAFSITRSVQGKIASVTVNTLATLHDRFAGVADNWWHLGYLVALLALGAFTAAGLARPTVVVLRSGGTIALVLGFVHVLALGQTPAINVSQGQQQGTVLSQGGWGMWLGAVGFGVAMVALLVAALQQRDTEIIPDSWSPDSVA